MRTGNKLHRAADEASTTNLGRHVRDCEPVTASPASIQMMAKFVGGYTREALRWSIIKWVAGHNRPYSIVEDEAFISLIHMLNPRANIPTANTVSLDLKLVHTLMTARLIDHLKVSSLDFIAHSLLLMYTFRPTKE